MSVFVLSGAALVTPFPFYANGALQISLGNESLTAGLVAALIVWRTRSVLLTLGAGMATPPGRRAKVCEKYQRHARLLRLGQRRDPLLEHRQLA